MSQQSTGVGPELFAYVRSRTTPEDDFLTELKAAASRAGLPAIAISPEQGSFLQILLRLSGAKEVVEVGTLAGYSALWMARALPDNGRVRTVEYEPAHADFAEAWIARSDVADRIEVHRGAGLDVLPRFADQSADAAFIDADKVNYGAYLDHALRIVRPGGLIAFDNAFAFGHLLDESQGDSVASIRAFNDRLAAEPRLQAVIVPLGDGLWVGVVR